MRQDRNAVFMFASLCFTAIAHADMVEFDGSGHLWANESFTFSFRFVYDTEAEKLPFSDLFDDLDAYPVLVAEFMIGDYTFDNADNVSLNVSNGHSNIDSIYFTGHDNSDIPIEDRRRWNINFIDPDLQVLNSTVPPHPSDFNINDFPQWNGNFRSWVGTQEPGWFFWLLETTEVNVRIIPAPSAIGLLCAGCLSIRRRRDKSGAYRRA